jgi:hypothetical protein
MAATAARSGRRSGTQSPRHVFFNTARSNGIEIRKGRGAGSEAQRTEDRKEARFCGDAEVDHVRCEKSVRESAAATTCVLKTSTLNVQTRSREALPHTGRTAVSWPRRGCRGLHLHIGAFPTAIPDRSRHRGYGIWIATSEYQLRPGSTERFEQDYKTRHECVGGHSLRRSTSQWPMAASWLQTPTLGAPGDRRELHWGKSSSSAVPPLARPIASEYPPTLWSIGVPQWDQGDDTDKF